MVVVQVSSLFSISYILHKEKNTNLFLCVFPIVNALLLLFQLLSLLLAMVLRAMVSPKSSELDDEEDYENPRSKARDPLLGSQANQASAGPSKIENWSSRMREKVKHLITFSHYFYISDQVCESVADKKTRFLWQYGLSQSQAVNPKG